MQFNVKSIESLAIEIPRGYLTKPASMILKLNIYSHRIHYIVSIRLCRACRRRSARQSNALPALEIQSCILTGAYPEKFLCRGLGFLALNLIAYSYSFSIL